ncbi:hypothetical protein J1N10_03555 [Carboxylicivirga sp. A043]|uniref:hypothetical protein n=1 Tax=Carboxylicivirga litoralis TaxID=2816963 RepID=UPI0021CAE8BC|nr:hypothetical protein [Carboxylicivirga sp. A043]MCU4155035.1 hypothetical protein [Carboxylicivirga sp. A043]
MYINRLIFIIILLVSLLVISCQKKEFTEPVRVNLEVALAEGSSSYFTFYKGCVMFEQILFDGQRQQGGDVHFATEEDNNIGPIEFQNNSVGIIKKFDIPQGIYNNMQWRFVLDEIETDEIDGDDDDSETEDLEEGGLILTGVYTNLEGEQIPIYIIIDEDEQLRASSQNESSYGDIILSSENSYSAQLLIDPYYAMQSISIESMEEAEISDSESSDFIEISEDENETLYEIIAFRIQSTLKVVIK